MLNQKINALKITNALLDLMRDDEDNPRMSLLDLQILLTINMHPTSGKNDLLEIINGNSTSKSFLDRPIDRLLTYQLIDKIINDDAVTKNGDARASYTVSKIGMAFIKNCSKGSQS